MFASASRLAGVGLKTPPTSAWRTPRSAWRWKFAIKPLPRSPIRRGPSSSTRRMALTPLLPERLLATVEGEQEEQGGAIYDQARGLRKLQGGQEAGQQRQDQGSGHGPEVAAHAAGQERPPEGVRQHQNRRHSHPREPRGDAIGAHGEEPPAVGGALQDQPHGAPQE